MKFESGLKTKIESFKDIEIIAKNISKIKNVEAVYLFGSYARGEIHAKSDVDFCVFLKKEDEKTISEVSSYSSDNVDISFFHMLPLAIRFRVFKEGKPLAIKDKSFIDILKISTWKNYLDIKPLINRYCMERFGCTI